MDAGIISIIILLFIVGAVFFVVGLVGGQKFHIGSPSLGVDAGPLPVWVRTLLFVMSLFLCTLAALLFVSERYGVARNPNPEPTPLPAATQISVVTPEPAPSPSLPNLGEVPTATLPARTQSPPTPAPPTTAPVVVSQQLSRCDWLAANFPQSPDAIAAQFGLPVNRIRMVKEGCGETANGFVVQLGPPVELVVDTANGGCIDAPQDAVFSDATVPDTAGGLRAYSGTVRAVVMTYRPWC
jgi:hypothetical protein